MKHRNAFVLAAVVLLSPLVAHAAGQEADAARFTIMAPVQAAYDAYQATAGRAQNHMDAIEAELRDGVTADRRQALAVSLAALRAREAAALGRLQAESALAQLKMADFNAIR